MTVVCPGAHTLLSSALITLAIISLVKVTHFLFEIGWLLRSGDQVARRFEDALADNSLPALVRLVRELRDRTHVVIWRLRRRADRGTWVRRRSISLFVRYLYRMPVLIIGIAGMGYLAAEGWRTTLAGFVVAICVLTSCLYFATSRIVLGVANNFYNYYSYGTYDTPVKDAELVSHWRYRHFIRDFLLGFLIIFASFIFGMGYVHFAVERGLPGPDYSISGNNPLDTQCSITSHSRASECGTWATLVTFTYFSIVVITTTGFGDIYPVSWAARAATISEIALNILFITVLLFGVSTTGQLAGARPSGSTNRE